MSEGRAKYQAMVDRSVARLKARRKKHGTLLTDRALMIEINRGCTAGCSTCFHLDTPRQTMGLELFKRVMAFADDHLFMAYLVGGEPTECLDMIVEMAAATPDLLVMLVTFGESLTPTRVRRMASSPNIFPVLSVDGIGDVNDRSRRPGSFARVGRAIDELNHQGVSFGISTVVSRINIDQVLAGDMADWVEDSGAALWDIIQYHPIGDNKSTHENLTLDLPQQAVLSSYRQELFARNPYGFAFLSADNPDRRCPRKLMILTDGKISYCAFGAWELGAIAATDDDRTIAARLQAHRGAWNAMATEGDGYCPLTHATKAFISFHERYGRLFQKATGLLDRAGDYHA